MVSYKTGETVRYKPVGGPDSNTSESTGTIRGVLTSPGVQADRNVQASQEQPRYEVRLLPHSSMTFDFEIWLTRKIGREFQYWEDDVCLREEHTWAFFLSVLVSEFIVGLQDWRCAICILDELKP